MKKIFSILFLFFAVNMSAQIQAPTRFGAGLRLTSADEVTDFNNFEGIPLLRKSDGLINNWIHSDSIALKSDIPISFPLNFADELGVVKYSSNTDKRTGYYDTSTQTYYPDILKNGGRVVLNPKDASFVQTSSTNATPKYLIELPAGTNALENFSFDIDIWDMVDQGGAEKTSTKIRASFYKQGTDRFYPILLKSNDLNVNYKWQLEYGLNNGNTAITLRQVGVNYILPIRISISNLQCADLGGFFDVLDVYEGWNISYLNNGVIDFVSGTIDEKDMLPFGKLELQDANGNNSFNKELVYDLTNKEYGYVDKVNSVQSIVAGSNVTVDNTDPLNPIINATSGGGATNLTYTPSATQGVINSDTGTNATIPLADATNAGLMKADFYEEIDFTPVIEHTGGGNDFTYTSTTSVGKIVRTGNLVTYNVYMSGINMPTNTAPEFTGTMQITLPFATGSSLNRFSVNQITQFITNGSVIPSDTQAEVQNNKVTFIEGRFLNSGRENVGKLNIVNGTLRLAGSFISNVYTP